MAGGMRLTMDGATATPDGIDVSGGHPAAENDGKVARIKGGANMPRPALCKLRATAIITHQICSQS